MRNMSTSTRSRIGLRFRGFGGRQARLISSTAAAKSFGKMTDDLVRDGRSVVITRHGRPRFVMFALDEEEERLVSLALAEREGGGG